MDQDPDLMEKFKMVVATKQAWEELKAKRRSGPGAAKP
jgi:hypothetical protein